MEPLVASGIITDSECQTIFSNIKDLAEVNRVMASKLEERKAQTLDQGKDVGVMLVGDIFCEMVRAFFTTRTNTLQATKFSVYQHYCINQTVAFQFVQQLQTSNGVFAEFVSVCCRLSYNSHFFVEDPGECTRRKNA